MPVTLRAAPRKASWRSSARAAEASCSTSSTAPGSSGSGEPCTVMPLLVQPRAVHREVVVGDAGVALADLLDQQEQRVVLGNQVAQPKLRQARGRDAEELLGRMVDEAEAVLGIEQHHRHRQGARICAMSGARRRSRSARRGAGDRVDHAASAQHLRRAAGAARRRRRGRSAGRRSVDQPQDRVGVRQPVHRRAELGRTGQTARVPGYVLARQAHAGAVPKCVEDRVVMRCQHALSARASGGSGRRLRRCAGNARPGRGTRAGRSSRGRSSPRPRPTGAAPRRHPPRSGCRRWRSPGCPTASFTWPMKSQSAVPV